MYTTDSGTEQDHIHCFVQLCISVCSYIVVLIPVSPHAHDTTYTHYSFITMAGILLRI